jgi:acyl dehydratase
MEETMNVPVKIARNDITIVPALSQALEQLAEEGRTPAKFVGITQEMVDRYTALFEDTNIIHKADAPGGAIVPGLFVLSLLPRLSTLQQLTEVAGYIVYNIGVSCEFQRPVPVGESIGLTFTVGNPLINRMGIRVPAIFTIIAQSTGKHVAQGEITLLFRQN